MDFFFSAEDRNEGSSRFSLAKLLGLALKLPHEQYAWVMDAVP